MARLARVSSPGLPYHVTQRGNRRNAVFFESDDRRIYKRWLARYAAKYELEVWAYCLMTNHVHLLVLGHHHESMAQAIGRTHGRYAQLQNRRHKWSGHFWANRFYSTPLDQAHLWAAVKYVELNPVRAGIVQEAESYEWSSAWAHANGLYDPLLSPTRPFPGEVSNWSEWLASGLGQKTIQAIRMNTSSGHPSGSDAFVTALEKKLGRPLKRQKRGRRPSSLDNRALATGPTHESGQSGGN